MHIEVWCFLSDQGPDRVGASNVIAHEVAQMGNNSTVWIVWQWCLQNIGHLDCETHLALYQDRTGPVVKHN